MNIQLHIQLKFQSIRAVSVLSQTKERPKANLSPVCCRTVAHTYLRGVSGWSTKLASCVYSWSWRHTLLTVQTDLQSLHCSCFKKAWKVQQSHTGEKLKKKTKPKPKTQNKTENTIKQKTQSKENFKTHTLLQLSGLRQADEWSSRLYPVYLPGEKE